MTAAIPRPISNNNIIKYNTYVLKIDNGCVKRTVMELKRPFLLFKIKLKLLPQNSHKT